MNGMSTVQRTAAVPLGGTVTMDQVLSVAPVKEVVVVNGARPAPVSSPAGAFNLRAEQFTLMPVAPHAVRSRRARAGPDRQHAEQQPGHHRRRLRLRQRVPDGRRRHQRQRARPAEQPLHRGRDPGTAGADVGHLRRVRPLQRRRRQRDHEERRQPVLGRVPLELHQPGLGRGDAVREERRHDPRQQAVADLRNHAGRSAGARPRVVLRRRADRADDHAGHVCADAHPVHEPQRQHALRRQGDRHASPAATRCRARSSTTARIWCSRPSAAASIPRR